MKTVDTLNCFALLAPFVGTYALERIAQQRFPPNFDAWLMINSKDYATAEEYQLRREIFLTNQALVEQHNQAFRDGLTTYAMTAAGPFVDLTDEEFASTYLMEPQHCSATHTSSGTLKPKDSLDLPEAIDWRTHGIITPIKNQKKCGSCWTFSTTGCLEAHMCLAAQRGGNSKKMDCTTWAGLAEQQLVDCAGDFNNFGCSGGLPSQAFEYVKYAGGLDLEPTYPYHAQESGQCKASSGLVGGQVAEVYNITSRDEDDLAHAISKVGPVSIAYQVSPDFRFYSHGVYDSLNATTQKIMCHDTPQDVNHAVVAVGLGSDADNNPFYIVRNSWGTSWGMEGYFWMKRGENLCGVSDCASFPIVPSVDQDKTVERSKFLRTSKASVVAERS